MNYTKELNIITIDALTWRPGKDRPPIIDNVSLQLEQGNFYGVLGPNGAGKTTLVKHILGLVKNDSGHIYFDGVDMKTIKRNELARYVAFLSQNTTKDVDFSVEEVVAMAREPYRKSFSPLSKRDVEIITEAMEYTNCLHLREKSICHISGGERQRVMIARAIAQDTPWIILDEPTSNLDIKHQLDLMSVLDKLKKDKKKTIVAVLHDINLAKKYCDKIIMMKEGRVELSGNNSEVLTSDNLSRLYGVDVTMIFSDIH